MRGQSTFLDFITGFFIFMIVLIISISFISSGTERSEKLDVERVSNDLLSPGIPEHWNASTVMVGGILSDNVVNNTKWTALSLMNAQDLQETLRLSSDIRISMLRHDGVNYQPVLNPISTDVLDSDADTIATTSRIAAFNGELVIIEVTAWR